MAREESDREKEGKLSLSLHAHTPLTPTPPHRLLPLCPLGCAGNPMLWWGEIAKAQPRVACTDTLVTSAPLTNGGEHQPPAVRALASAPPAS